MSIKTDNSQTLVNALAEIERLQGRVSELEVKLENYEALKRMHRLENYPNELTARAWLLRKQAEAVEGYAAALRLWLRDMPGNPRALFAEGVNASAEQADRYAQRLRNQADELEHPDGRP